MTAQAEPLPTGDPATAGEAAPRIPGHRFVRKLGQGGHAVVYLFKDEQLGREVAVKILSTRDEPARRQFENEMRIVSGFDSPFIVPIMQPGETPDGRPYFLMPYCSGGSLAAAVAPGQPPMPVARAVEIGGCIAEALAVVHGKRFVHRDVKPSNVLLDEQGRPRLSDFGIAGPLAEAAPLAPREDFPISVAWSPAEMLDGAHGNAASDLYSLGATLWHLLAGRSPFEIPGGDNTAAALERRIKAGKPQPLRREDVPARLRSVLFSLLSLDPARRPKSAREVAAALAAAGSEPAPHPRSAGPSTQETEYRPKVETAPAAFPESDGTWESPEPVYQDTDIAGSGVRRRLLVSAGVVAVMGAVAAGVGVLLHDPSTAAASSGPAASGALAASQGPQDPGVLGEHVPPGPATVTARRLDADTLGFAWTYAAALPGDTFSWRTADGKQSGVAKSAAVNLADPAGRQLCVQVKVVRADGSDASVDWSAAGCGS
jgi:hypothetical protein